MLTLSIFSVRVCLVHKQCRKQRCRRRRSQNFTSEGRGFAEVASGIFRKIAEPGSLGTEVPHWSREKPRWGSKGQTFLVFLVRNFSNS